MAKAAAGGGRVFLDFPCVSPYRGVGQHPATGKAAARLGAGSCMGDKLWYLKQCLLFERLPAKEVAWLESCARHQRFATGGVVYLPAAEADAVLALVAGRVKICHSTPEGKESILAFIEPGEVFGELCLVDDAVREELAIAARASVVVLIPRTALLAVIERCPALALSISGLLGLRRRRLERRLKYLLFRSTRDRLVHLLLDLAGTERAGSADSPPPRLSLSHQDLAGLIGSTRETVSGTLGDLQSEGLVRLGRQNIHLLDVPSLRRLVELETIKTTVRRGAPVLAGD